MQISITSLLAVCTLGFLADFSCSFVHSPYRLQKNKNVLSMESEGIIGIPEKNILGERLQACCFQPKTGFYRDGFCSTGTEDVGQHTICVRVDADFLEFSAKKGNDLSTPYPEYGFPGLKPDDCWCLCAGRWKEANQERKAPKVILAATHMKALEIVTLEQLMIHASGDNTNEDEMQ
jgi:uncharacterized protein (DUF2237 family)